MDDPLRAFAFRPLPFVQKRLNPYCNGWSSKRPLTKEQAKPFLEVLILIVMDDPLRADGLVFCVSPTTCRLNPYCNGWSSKSVLQISIWSSTNCLNPYCNGWSSKRKKYLPLQWKICFVLILIVMDDPLRVLKFSSMNGLKKWS